MAKGQSNPKVVMGGSALLALMFLVGGSLKLLGPQIGLNVGEQFAQLGYPDWLCPVLGGVEVAAALIILVPRIAWIGALVLMAVTTGYLWIFWRNDQPTQVIGPSLLFMTCAVLFYLRYPWKAAAAGKREDDGRSSSPLPRTRGRGVGGEGAATSEAPSFSEKADS
jgi:uncharacterized membrane protein YphA (DoxX/SURF4 family)